MPLAWRAPLGTEAAPGRPRTGSGEAFVPTCRISSRWPWPTFSNNSGHLLSYPPEDPRPPLGYIVRVENMEAQHIHHPNVADDPAELRAVEAALDVHITPVIPATSGEPAAPGSSRLTSPEHDDLESFGRGPPPPLPVNRPPSGEPPASAPARGDALTPHPVLAALAKAGALG